MREYKTKKDTKMKKLFLLISVFVLTAACQKEVPIGDNRSVEIRISTGNTLAGATRANDDGADAVINDVTILVFANAGDDPENATFMYHRYAWKKANNLYNTVLLLGEDLDLYFAINVRDIIDKAVEDGDFGEGTSFADVKEVLKLVNERDLEEKGLPMWGYRRGVSIFASAINNFGTIKVLRAVATAEITVSADNFDLSWGSVEYAANHGKLAYTFDNIKFSDTEIDSLRPTQDYKLRVPEVPASLTTVDRVVAETIEDKVVEVSPGVMENQQIIAGQLYFYENDYDAGKNAGDVVGTNYTKVVIGGVWDPTPDDITDNADLDTTYYPMAFRNRTLTEGSNLRTSIIRNTKFIFKITNVNGPGYDSVNKAKEGEDLNIEYDVIAWDEWDDLEIVSYAGMWISVGMSRNEQIKSGGETKLASLYRNASSTDEVAFTTNIAFDDFKLKLDDEIEEPTLQYETAAVGQLKTGEAIKGKIANAYYEVYLVEGTTEGTGREAKTQARLLFFALQPYAARTASRLTIGNSMLEYYINVRQMNSTLQDWIDGGDQPWTAEGKE